MHRRAVLGTLGAVAAAGGALYLGAAPRRGAPGFDLGAAHAEDAPGSPATGGTAPAADMPPVGAMTEGDPAAKVEVIEYASYTCPHCAHFHSDVWPLIKKNYLDTGKIRFTIHEVYFDRFGLWAAMLARCGGDMRYFGIADMIFDTQDEWLAGGDPVKATANLKKIGLKAGMTAAQIDACMGNADFAQALVTEFQKNMEKDQVEGTPTFFINGTKYPNMGYDEFAKALDDALAKV